jgi:hypothetical protein
MRQAFTVPEPRHAALRALNYDPAIERIRQPKRGRGHVRLRELVADLGSGYATVFARIDCDRTQGVELLSQTDMFAAEPQGRFIRRDSMQHPERHEVKRWHILIAGAGTLAPTELYGRAIIADGRLAGKFVGQDTLIIEFEEPEADFSLFTYAYLASPTGLRALRSASYGTKILRIRRDILAELPVPRADDRVVQRVAALMRRCVEQRELFLHELLAARRVIEALPEMREAHGMCSERRARSTLWSGALGTLNAWNYASAGEALPFLLKKWSTRIGDLVPGDGLFRGGRYQRVPCEPPFGIDFLNQRDVFSIRPVPRRILEPSVAKEWVYVPEYSLLAGGQGTLGEGEIFGQVALVTPDLARAGVTEHLLRIHARDRSATGTLYAFLSTLVGRRLLRSTGVGTKLLSLRPDLVAALPIPSIGDGRSKEIVSHLEAGGTARGQASEAEEEAIRIVEEEVLPAWLA